MATRPIRRRVQTEGADGEDGAPRAGRGRFEKPKKKTSRVFIVILLPFLVLCGVVAVFVVVPTLKRASDSARSAADMSNMSQIGKAMTFFSNVDEIKGAFPASLDHLVPDYIKDERVFVSPLVPDGQHGAGPGNLKYCDYTYIAGVNPDFGGPVLLGPANQSGEHNVLISSGAVLVKTKAEFDALLSELKAAGAKVD